MSRSLVAWPPPGASAHDVLADVATLATLEAALDGTGPAVVAAQAVDPADWPSVPDEAAVIIATSGTTGQPKPAMLAAASLAQAVDGVQDAFGGPGQSLLAVPPSHITGIAVILRNLAAGHEPVAVAPGHFDGAAFVEATRRLDPRAARRYVTLVPTQLHRLLADPEAVAALRDYDVVGVGAAPLPTVDRARARALGIRLVDGYGCSETSGGCLYDGRPLPGTDVVLDGDGRVHVGGPLVALGYLGRPDADAAFGADASGRRWFRTNDHGRLLRDGRVQVVGRLDDLIISGGLKVAPTVVEDALGAAVPELGETLVVGAPDAEWGEAVTVLAVAGTVTGQAIPTLPTITVLRDRLRHHLPAHALPRSLHLVEALPRRGPGKLDRVTARALVSGP